MSSKNETYAERYTDTFPKRLRWLISEREKTIKRK